MSSGGEKRGKKRSKAFYRKSTYGGKRPREGANVLEPGIRGFLVMCNSNEGSAVKESYNILNEYADLLYGQDQAGGSSVKNVTSSDEDSECDDVEKALKKEIEAIKNTAATQRRFQNIQTKAKNCVFIRTTVEDPVKMVVNLMEDIAQRGLKKARYAARMLPIIGTCKAHTSDIEKLAKDVLQPIFCKDNTDAPTSYTVLFKIRNNNANTCGKNSVIPAVTKVVSEINPAVKFSWTDFDVAVLVEVICTVCCLGVAPGYTRLRKYNLQELQQGPKVKTSTIADANPQSTEQCLNEPEKKELETHRIDLLPEAASESIEKCVNLADSVMLDVKSSRPQTEKNNGMCSNYTDGKLSEEPAVEPNCPLAECVSSSISVPAVNSTDNVLSVVESSVTLTETNGVCSNFTDGKLSEEPAVEQNCSPSERVSSISVPAVNLADNVMSNVESSMPLLETNSVVCSDYTDDKLSEEAAMEPDCSPAECVSSSISVPAADVKQNSQDVEEM